MKRIMKLTALVLTLAVLLCSCGEAVDYRDHLQEYVQTLEYHDGFTVLQLTDIHWSTGTQIGNDTYGSRAYLKKVIEEAEDHAGKIDLIEITGDTFMLANASEVTTFVDFMEQFEIPYAITWGNHDREGTYNPNWLSEIFMVAPHSLYTEVDGDNVHDRGNYVINLQKDGETVWQIVNLDSGASYREGAGDLSLTYDYLRQDQLDWLSAEHAAAGNDVPVLCYYHIAQAENDLAFADVSSGADGYRSGFFKLENFAPSRFATDTRSVFGENHVVGAFMGHAHAVDWTFTTPEGITYGLGVKSGTELYYGTVSPDDVGETDPGFDVTETFDLIGASLVTIRNTDGDFTLEHLYYNEREGEDFSLWVTYGD